MSLWLQSLDEQLAGAEGEGDARLRNQAGILLAFFSMRVPGQLIRMWHAYREGEPDEIVASLWPKALERMRAVPELRDLTMAQLLALSFRGGLGLNDEQGSLADPDVKHPFADYVTAANRQLDETPELRGMAEKLDAKG